MTHLEEERLLCRSIQPYSSSSLENSPTVSSTGGRGLRRLCLSLVGPRPEDDLLEGERDGAGVKDG